MHPGNPYHAEIFLVVVLLAAIASFCFTAKRGVDVGRSRSRNRIEIRRQLLCPVGDN